MVKILLFIIFNIYVIVYSLGLRLLVTHQNRYLIYFHKRLFTYLFETCTFRKQFIFSLLKLLLILNLIFEFSI